MTSITEFDSVIARMHNELQSIPILELAEAVPAGARHEDSARQAFLRGISVYRGIASTLDRTGMSVNWPEFDDMSAANRIYISRTLENRSSGSDDDDENEDELPSRPTAPLSTASPTKPSTSKQNADPRRLDLPCPRCRKLGRVCHRPPYKPGMKRRPCQECRETHKSCADV